MSTQPAPAPVPETTPKEIPQLTKAYRKAYKNYFFAAVLLASWELLGISLARKNRGFEIESPPTGLMLLLFIPVIYCGYKMTAEWMLCDPECRKRLAAKWNPHTAHAIALIAIAISIIQYIFHIQIAEYIAHHQLKTFVVIAVVMTAVGAVPIYSRHTIEDNDPETQRALHALGISRSSLLTLAISPAVFSCIEAIENGTFTLFFLVLPAAVSAWVLYRNRKKTKANKA